MKLKVWEEDDAEDQAFDIEALDVREAAEAQADYDHRRRDGWEWSWPVDYKVKTQSGEVYTVSVDRDVHPVFVGGKPKLVGDTGGER